ncbi:MAG TPA: glycosyltransferase family 2 protein [Ktedonobacteraceae bacterium]
MRQSDKVDNWTDLGASATGSRLLAPETTLSFVVPVMNEEGNVRALYDRLALKMRQLGMRYEVIFIDDGSTDRTFFELRRLYQEHPETIEIIRFRRNFGKTPALVAGFSCCRGDVVFTMDGDLQDDPDEIPRFLEKLDEGYDLVTGWKFPRLDPLTKTFPSRIFNGLVGRVTGLPLHDINCGFKAYRREIFADIHLKLYGDFHRFIPTIAHWRGFRVAEIKVRHHPRTSGISKFGGRRFVRGLIDLLTIQFLTSSLHTPLRLFSRMGGWTFLLGVLVDLFVVMRSFFLHVPIHDQPLLFVGIIFLIFGFLFLLIGLLAEMIRYYAFEPGEEYSVKESIMRREPMAISGPLSTPPVVTTGSLSQPPPRRVEQEPISVAAFSAESLVPDWGEVIQPGWNKQATGKQVAMPKNIPPRRPNIVPLQ